MIKFTIIIPHYNSSIKCKRLLDSIPNRKDLEVIVVDDKSEEKEYDQLKKFIEQCNKNIKFYTNNGKKGAGTSRNLGIKNSVGKWLIFADADDFFLNTFDNILEKYKNNKKDIIFFNMTSIYEDSKKIAERHINYNLLVNNYLQNKKNSEKQLRLNYYSPCGKIYNRNYIIKNNFVFDEVVASNDVYFSLTSSYDANIFVTEEYFYCITRGKGTLTVNYSEEIFDSRFKVQLKVDKFLRQKKEIKYRKHFLGYLLRGGKYNYKKPIKMFFMIRNNKSSLFSLKIIMNLFSGIYLKNFYRKIKNKKYQIR